MEPYFYPPVESVVIPIDQWLRECDIPDDSDWPAPENFREVILLLRKLSEWASAACALIGAEMAWSIIANKGMQFRMTDDEIKNIRDYLDLLWDVVKRDIPKSELYNWRPLNEPADEFDSFERYIQTVVNRLVFGDGDVRLAINSIKYAGQAVKGLWWDWSTQGDRTWMFDPKNAADHTLDSMVDAWIPNNFQFQLSMKILLADWWRLCRCYLPFILPAEEI